MIAGSNADQLLADLIDCGPRRKLRTKLYSREKP